MTPTAASVSFTELTPLAFLERAAQVFADKTAIVYHERRISYRDFARAAARLGNALRASGIRPGDRVAYLMPNVPEMLIAHFGVGLAGAILVAINTRLAPEEVLYICNHSGATMLVVDAGLHPTVAPVVSEFDTVREIITVVDAESGAQHSPEVSGPDYDEFLSRGSDDPLPWTVPDESGPISINYTSGTTGKPKGVVYHHRGAYLNALCNIVTWGMPQHSVYLWTLPMFHCNGWCFPWTMAANAGTNVCLRKVEAKAIFEEIRKNKVTHYCGAPIVHSMLVNAPDRKSTRLNSSHMSISYAVFCLKKKKRDREE